MRVYYNQAEYEPGKHKIMKSWSNKFLQPRPEDDVNEAINIPFGVIELDEDWIPGLAKALVGNLRTSNQGILPDRLYVDNAVPPQIHLTDTGAVVPVTANPNKADWILSILHNVTPAQIDAYFDTNVTTLGQAKEAFKKLAKIVVLIAKQIEFE